MLYISSMNLKNIYETAHIFVSGVRIFEHLHERPPMLKDLADILKVSEEELSLISRRLADEGIIHAVASGAQCRFSVADHTKIETLPRSAEPPRMAEEISQFQTRRQSRLSEIEKTLGENADKKRVFSDIEKALKDHSSLQKKKNPLD